MLIIPRPKSPFWPRLIFVAATFPIFANFAFPNLSQMDLIGGPDGDPRRQFAVAPVVVSDKPFQPKWSNSLGIRRKISRPNGAGQQQRNKGKEKEDKGGDEKAAQNSQPNSQLKRPPSPLQIGNGGNGGGMHNDEWTSNIVAGEQQGGEHKIVHLTSRPTQLYYFQQDEPELSGDTVELGAGQVCRVKVPSSEIFYIAYEDGAGTRPSVDLFFHCSQYWAWCCGVDCCQVDPTLLLVGFCICMLILAFLVHLCLRSKFCRRICLDRLFRRRKRVIARANAQRRKRSGSSGQGGELRKIRTNSLKEIGGKGHHKKLAKASTRDCAGVSRKMTREIPEIVITEPSSCYEPSYKSASEMEDEEEDEAYEDEEDD